MPLHISIGIHHDDDHCDDDNHEHIQTKLLQISGIVAPLLMICVAIETDHKNWKCLSNFCLWMDALIRVMAFEKQSWRLPVVGHHEGSVTFSVFMQHASDLGQHSLVFETPALMVTKQ